MHFDIMYVKIRVTKIHQVHFSKFQISTSKSKTMVLDQWALHQPGEGRQPLQVSSETFTKILNKHISSDYLQIMKIDSVRQRA